MELIAHGIALGPCPTPAIKAWGKGDAIKQYKKALLEADPRVKQIPKEHRFTVRIDFHLAGSRLKLSDLDNLSKTVLDGIFGTFGKRGLSPMDRFVWRLEAAKIRSDKEELTEFWVFDEGPMK